ncbi:MAG TPA: AAA family ATPase [Chloroflexota bacterium]|nr:AAA family ATPase [Chloroflexota bacterium]
MRRVLLTGLSGTGKSTLVRELAARGYKAIDLDGDAWSHWVEVPEDPAGPAPLSPDSPARVWQTRDWLWREDLVRDLLATEDAPILFVSGCAPNQSAFRRQFDHVVLLTAPPPVIVNRLATRTTNDYGKHPDELARVLEQVQSVEPLLRRSASHEVDTSAPLDDVVEQILSHVLPGHPTS